MRSHNHHEQPTREYRPPHLRIVKPKTSWTTWGVVSCLSIIIICLASYIAFGQRSSASKKEDPKKPKTLQVWEAEANLDEKIDIRAREMAREMARQENEDFFAKNFDERMVDTIEKWSLGCLEIRDFETSSALHRQAAIKGKEKFVALPKDTMCMMHYYVVKDRMGIGIASTVVDSQRYFFLVKWREGALAPPENVKKFRVVQGKKIEIVSSK